MPVWKAKNKALDKCPAHPKGPPIEVRRTQFRHSRGRCSENRLCQAHGFQGSLARLSATPPAPRRRPPPATGATLLRHAACYVGMRLMRGLAPSRNEDYGAPHEGASRGSLYEDHFMRAPLDRGKQHGSFILTDAFASHMRRVMSTGSAPLPR